MHARRSVADENLDSMKDYRLLWLPPVMQEFSNRLACDRWLSSFRPLLATFLKPLAGMVICGSGPNLTYEL